MAAEGVSVLRDVGQEGHGLGTGFVIFSWIVDGGNVFVFIVAFSILILFVGLLAFLNVVKEKRARLGMRR